MSKILIDPAMPNGPKFISGPDLALTLWFKAMCYSALNKSDGFVPTDVVYDLVKARRRDVDKAVEHLTTVQPRCDNPSFHACPGGWLIHDYGDPLYRNPMRKDDEKLRDIRSAAGEAGGKASARARLEKYGTTRPLADPPATTEQPDGDQTATQEPLFEGAPKGGPARSRLGRDLAKSGRAASSAGEANAEAASDLSASEVGSASPPTSHEANVKLPSLHLPSPPFHTEHGDMSTEVVNGSTPSPQVQVLRLLDWFMAKRGWSSWSDEATQKREAQRAIAIVELGIPREQLFARLDAMWDASDADDRPSSLGIFWTRLQDEQHAALKGQRSHVRTDEPLTKLVVPPVAAKRGEP